jgi:hypothetical protein
MGTTRLRGFMMLIVGGHTTRNGSGCALMCHAGRRNPDVGEGDDAAESIVGFIP